MIVIRRWQPIRGHFDATVRMPVSRSLAALIGPSLVAIALSEALNIRIFAGNAPAVVYLNGAILFVAGLAIIRAHNLWVWQWPVAVTLTGWLLAGLGLFRLFAPELQPGGRNAAIFFGIFVAFVLGCFLTFKAYVAGGSYEETEL